MLPNVQSEPPLVQLWTIPTNPVAELQGAELSMSFPTSPPRGAEHSSDVAHQPPSLQTPPFLAGQTFQPFYLFGCLLDEFMCVSIVLNFCGLELHGLLLHVYILVTNIEARKGKNLQFFAFFIPFYFKSNVISIFWILLVRFSPLFCFLLFSICTSTCSVRVLFKNVYRPGLN